MEGKGYLEGKGHKENFVDGKLFRRAPQFWRVGWRGIERQDRGRIQLRTMKREIEKKNNEL